MVIKLKRTTLTIPADLLDAADRAIQHGYARSRNDLIAIALRRELAARERAAIDAAFEGMATDTAYQATARQLTREFNDSDWEALQAGETVRQ